MAVAMAATNRSTSSSNMTDLINEVRRTAQPAAEGEARSAAAAAAHAHAPVTNGRALLHNGDAPSPVRPRRSSPLAVSPTKHESREAGNGKYTESSGHGNNSSSSSSSNDGGLRSSSSGPSSPEPGLHTVTHNLNDPTALTAHLTVDQNNESDDAKSIGSASLRHSLRRNQRLRATYLHQQNQPSADTASLYSVEDVVDELGQSQDKLNALQRLYTSVEDNNTRLITLDGLRVLILTVFPGDDDLSSRNATDYADPAFLQSMMRRLDYDGDGGLSFVEFVTSFDLFVDLDGNPTNFKDSLFFAGCAALIERLNELKRSMQALQNEADIEQQQLRANMQELRATMLRRDAERDDILELASQDMYDLKATIKTLRGSLQETTTAHDKLKAAHAAQADQLEQLRLLSRRPAEERSDGEGELERSQLQARIHRLTDLEATIEELRQQILLLEQEARDYELRTNSLDQLPTPVQHPDLQSEFRIYELEEENRRLQYSSQQLQERLEQLSCTKFGRTPLDERLSDLEEQLRAAEAKYAAVDAQHAQLSTEVERWRQRFEAAEREHELKLEHREQQLRALRLETSAHGSADVRALNSLRRELDDLVAEVEARSSALDTAKDSLARQTDARRAAEEQLAQLRQELLRADQHSNRLQDQLHAATTAATEARREADQAQREADAVRQEAAARQEQLSCQGTPTHGAYVTATAEGPDITPRPRSTPILQSPGPRLQPMRRSLRSERNKTRTTTSNVLHLASVKTRSPNAQSLVFACLSLDSTINRCLLCLFYHALFSWIARTLCFPWASVRQSEILQDIAALRDLQNATSNAHRERMQRTHQVLDDTLSTRGLVGTLSCSASLMDLHKVDSTSSSLGNSVSPKIPRRSLPLGARLHEDEQSVDSMSNLSDLPGREPTLLSTKPRRIQRDSSGFTEDRRRFFWLLQTALARAWLDFSLTQASLCGCLECSSSVTFQFQLERRLFQPVHCVCIALRLSTRLANAVAIWRASLRLFPIAISFEPTAVPRQWHSCIQLECSGGSTTRPIDNAHAQHNIQGPCA
ncbi:uncharacterized protein MONBRDRAFT_6228 [Monosiga brevicollis MX1]|uniref:EF-hand domain-containing protein n=1 Tax=Monosiga brevicollis TaxID=81824 RepID=A9UT78_MONBE|nr:uncharacterized protein MONBRDRAFT_6228 [Monosiga brevicollis MX1]EDQ91199.1 predicted protein [Monosiga brevicollis MX1]|eukprot:XP_001743621.1 hypothetical protein [Monosiga brevicollis MX1]